jgi:hypothetical protein
MLSKSEEKRNIVRQSLKKNSKKVSAYFQLPNVVRADIQKYNQTAKSPINVSFRYVENEMYSMIAEKKL